jgi:hypothetical protein
VAALLVAGLGITVLNRDDKAVLRERVVLTKVALNTVRHHPVLGIGLNNHFTPCFSDVLSHREAIAVENLVGTHSHNIMLEVAQGMGLVGLSSFLWLLTTVCWFMLRSLRTATGRRQWLVLRAGSAALAALVPPHLVALSLSDLSLLPARFWLLLGLVIAGSRLATNDQGRAPGHRRGPATVAAALLCLAALLLVLRPNLAEVVRRQAAQARGQHRIAAATEGLQCLAWLRPWNARPLAALAEMSDDPAKTVAWYRAAIARRPLSALYHHHLAWAAWQQNQQGQQQSLAQVACHRCRLLFKGLRHGFPARPRGAAAGGAIADGFYGSRA